MKFLIVDDYEANLYMLRVLLEAYGYEVDSASNGKEALQIARQSPPDIIVTDILMPVMDGFVLCREWKQDEQLKAIPFVFYTATYTDDKDQKFAMSLGAERFIIKPTEPDVLMEMLEEVIENFEENQLTTEHEPVKEEDVYLREYNETLVRKLEEKVSILEDTITNLKNTEQELRRANRAYHVLSACNRTLIYATEELAFLNNLCKIIVETGGYQLAWVGFAEYDAKKTVRPVAQRGYSEDYLDSLHITWSDTEHGHGPTGTAIRTGEMSIARNILTDPNFEPWRDNALKYSYASSIALPLHIDNKAIGALNIYAKEAEAFDSQEVELLTELANDLAYGIHALRIRTAQEQAEAALRQRHAELEAVLDIAQDILFILKLDGTIINYRTSESTELYTSPEQFLGQKMQTLLSNEINEKFGNGINRLVETGIKQIIEYQLKVPAFEDAQWYEATLSLAHEQIIMVVHNITKRKLAEEEHRKLTRAVEQSANSIVITDVQGDIEYVNPKFTRLTGYSIEEVIGQNPRVLKSGFTPADEYKKLWETISSGQEWRGEFHNVKKNGEFYWESASISPVFDEYGTITHYIAVKEDITAQKLAEEARERLLVAEHEQRLLVESLIQTTLSLTTQQNHELMLAEILLQASRLVDFDGANIFLLEDDNALHYACSQGYNNQEKERLIANLVQPLTEFRIEADALEAVEPIIVPDVHQDSRWIDVEGTAWIQSCIVLPIYLRERALGVLRVDSSKVNHFTEKDVERLQPLANVAAIALENANLFGQVIVGREQMRHLSQEIITAQEIERQRIARELHDLVGQNMTAMGINLNLIQSQIPQNTSELVRSCLNDSIRLLGDTTEFVRSLMTELRPPVLDDYGLMAAFHWYGDLFAKRTGINIILRGKDPSSRITNAIENTLFRITQEALTNVSKHANASQVIIALQETQNSIQLQIVDDGIGFDVDKVSNSKEERGWGLLIIQERAEAIGGECQIISRLHEGTSITLEVKL